MRSSTPDSEVTSAGTAHEEPEACPRRKRKSASWAKTMLKACVVLLAIAALVMLFPVVLPLLPIILLAPVLVMLGILIASPRDDTGSEVDCPCDDPSEEGDEESGTRDSEGDQAGRAA